MNKQLFIVCLLLALMLTACGGGNSPSTTLDVTMIDFQFSPNQFTVPAGQEITVNIANTGAVVHNFIIMKLGTTAGDAFDEDDEVNVFWEAVDIQPGGETNTTFTAPTEPGEYQIVCRTAGHITSGMIGTLTVVAGE